jgi:hypothetical protein
MPTAQTVRTALPAALLGPLQSVKSIGMGAASARRRRDRCGHQLAE